VTTGLPPRPGPAAPDPGADAVLDVLARLFGGLDRVDLAKLSAHLEPLDLAPGEEVFRQGDPGDALYVVARGRFGVFVREAADALAPSATGGSPAEPGHGEMRVGSCREGDLFGEMALFADEPRSATVRAEEPGRVFGLPRERFLALMRQVPALSLAVAETLSRRLRTANVARAETEAFVARHVEEALALLPTPRRDAVLAASLLEAPTTQALASVFGEEAAAVAAGLAALGLDDPRTGAATRRSLRQRLAQEWGAEGLTARAAQVASRLAGAAWWDDALAVLARHGPRAAFVETLVRAQRAVPPLDPDRGARWIERLSDEEAVGDPELALARTAWLEARGEEGRALDLARRALGAGLLSGDPATARLAAEVTRLAGGDGRRSTRWRPLAIPLTEVVAWLPHSRWQAAAGLGAGIVLLAVAAFPGASPQRAFVSLLAAAVILMATRLVPDFAVGLGLVAGWVLLGLATPAQALTGFASKEWLFIVTVYGLAAAAARSGVLFRVGLLLVRRLPHGLGWQAATLLGTGLALTPLVPSSTGRVSLTEPLALAMAEALRLPERGPAAALLGLAAWVGAGPLMFVFLNGSGTCLLAWALLPDASRARFTWGQWLAAAGPLGLLVGLGAAAILVLQLRPAAVGRPSAAGVTLQVAVLGRPRPQELATLTILGLTVLGWILAPAIHLDLVTVALLGLLATVAVGTFNARAFQTLDWGVILFFGVVLSIGRLAVALGLDRTAAATLAALLARFPLGPVSLVLAVALLSVAARLVLEQDLTVLLASLTLVPLAPRVGVDPWVVMIAVLATSVAWILPTQTQAYLVAQAATEGRLFSPEQARRFALGYTAVTLGALLASVPYWCWLGLL
jgi:CRP-like cAMP-binding protein/di/tricarboxylate transporter